MKCRDTQFNISLNIDGLLDANEAAVLAEHLANCNACSARSYRLQDIKDSLNSMHGRGGIPEGVLTSLRSNISQLAEAGRGDQMFAYEIESLGIRTWAFPSLIGSLATITIAFGLLSAILSGSEYISSNELAANRSPASSTVFLANPNMNGPYDLEISSNDYAKLRMSVAGESPSVNPQGALVALTRSLVRGEMNEDELTVVADVFGNGLARIAEVIEPSNDQRAIERLDKALSSDPDFAPFVPADVDHRSQTMRVVLKIQSVNVEMGN